MSYWTEICSSIEQLKDHPVIPETAMTMASLLYIKDHEHKEAHMVHFDREMAESWAAGMKNADDTVGPKWSMEETTRLYKQHGLACDPEMFWVIMNMLYSDFCEALRESSASTPETYVRLAKAWIMDKDAVPNKAAAYYTHVVQH